MSTVAVRPYCCATVLVCHLKKNGRTLSSLEFHHCFEDVSICWSEHSIVVLYELPKTEMHLDSFASEREVEFDVPVDFCLSFQRLRKVYTLHATCLGHACWISRVK